MRHAVVEKRRGLTNKYSYYKYIYSTEYIKNDGKKFNDVNYILKKSLVNMSLRFNKVANKCKDAIKHSSFYIQ